MEGKKRRFEAERRKQDSLVKTGEFLIQKSNKRRSERSTDASSSQLSDDLSSPPFVRKRLRLSTPVKSIENQLLDDAETRERERREDRQFQVNVLQTIVECFKTYMDHKHNKNFNQLFLCLISQIVFN